MKKALSLFMTLLLVFSFVSLTACAKEGGQTREPEADATEAAAPETQTDKPDTAEQIAPGSSADAEETENAPGAAAEKTEYTADWTGKTIGISVGILADTMVKQIAEGIKSRSEDLGASASITDANLNLATQQEQVENFVVMKVDAIYCLSLDSSSLKDTVARALDAGIVFVLGGVAPTFPCSAAHNCDNVGIGRELGLMILDWLDQAYADSPDGSVHTGVMLSTDIEQLKLRGEKMVEVISADPRVNITYTKEGIQIISDGFDAAQEGMTADPAIRLWACYNDNVAVGANNYIMSLVNINLDEYAIFGAATSEVSRQCVDQVATFESVLRGLISYGTEDMGEGAFDCLYKAVEGIYEFGHVEWDRFNVYGTTGYEITEQTA